MILTTFKCDIPGCNAARTEEKPGDGAVGWGEVRGFALNGRDNPTLCPRHLGVLAEFMDTVMLTEGKK